LKRGLTVFSWVTIGAWGTLIALGIWWTFMPVVLPTVTQPMPILNEGKVVTVGEPILIELTITKPEEITPQNTTRFIKCQSGALIPVSAETLDIPVGQFTVVSDSTIMLPGATRNDVCVVEFTVRYKINPMRSDTVVYTSEQFLVRVPEGAEPRGPLAQANIDPRSN
jgi:hypothetical protein